MKENFPYEDQTLEGLLNLWVEAKSAGMDGLSNEIWEKLVLKDKKITEDKLKKTRGELELIIGC